MVSGKPEQSWRRGLLLLVAGAFVISAMVIIYLLAPTPVRTEAPWLYVVGALVLLAAYVLMTAIGIRRLPASRNPVVAGLLLVLLMATVLILGYSYIYRAIAVQPDTAFSEPLTQASAVYFTVTVLTTVGFGDITAVTDVARLVVTSQMLLGLTVISVGVKLIVQSTQSARRQQLQRTESSHGHGEADGDDAGPSPSAAGEHPSD